MRKKSPVGVSTPPPPPPVLVAKQRSLCRQGRSDLRHRVPTTSPLLYLPLNRPPRPPGVAHLQVVVLCAGGYVDCEESF